MSEANAAAKTTTNTGSGGGPTPVTGAEPVVLNGGDSPASWDELSSLTVKSRTPKPKKEAKEGKDEGTEEKADKKGSTEKEEVKVTGKGDKENKETKKVEKSESPAKLLKLKSGESTLEVAPDALVPVKINGKVIEVPIQEAINRYSQQSHLDELYKGYKTEKDGFEKQRQLMKGALDKSYDYLVNKKDLRGFLEFISEAMNVDGDQIYQETVGSLQKQLEEMSQLTPEERRIRELEMENNRFKERKEAEKKSLEEAKSRQALESQVREAMSSAGMTEKDLVEAWDSLTSHGVDPNEINTERLVSYHQSLKAINMVESELMKVSPEQAQNQELLEELTAYAIREDLGPEEMAEVVKQLFAEIPEKKLSNKINKNMAKNAQGGSKAVKNPGSDPLFFDDI